MVRTAAAAVRAALPNVDGWDLLGIVALGVFFYGLAVQLSFGWACIITGGLVLVVVFFIALRQAPVVTVMPPGEE